MGEVTSNATSIPFGQPIMRWKDLDENSTRWDYMVAAPEDGTLVTMWWGIGAVSLITAIVTLTVSLGILTSPSTRSSSFNIYLVYLLLPDFFLSFCCIFTCWLSARAGHFISPEVCRFESWYVMFGIAASAWTNFNIMREVYKMLLCGHQRKRYFAPTIKKVSLECLATYIGVAILASAGILPPSKFPLRTFPQSGYACVPLEYDVPSSLFYNLFYFQVVAGIPMIYVIYVNFDVLFWSKLLPPDPRARQFAIYFLRIIVIFFVWWLPAILFIFMVARTSPWFKWFWSTWVHWQGTASAMMCLLKPDVFEATKSLLSCRRGLDNGSMFGSSAFYRASLSAFFRATQNKQPAQDELSGTSRNMPFCQRSIIEELAVFPEIGKDDERDDNQDDDQDEEQAPRKGAEQAPVQIGGVSEDAH